MRKGGSSAKGSAFERKICRELSLWLTHGKKEDCLWRSAMSGGRATVAKSRSKFLVHQSGDICSVSPEGHVLTDSFFIETKHLRDLALTNFFLLGVGTLAKHWRTACREAESFNKRPFMIVRQNRLPVLVVYPDDIARCLASLKPVHVPRLEAVVCTFSALMALPPEAILGHAG